MTFNSKMPLVQHPSTRLTAQNELAIRILYFFLVIAGKDSSSFQTFHSTIGQMIHEGKLKDLDDPDTVFALFEYHSSFKEKSFLLLVDEPMILQHPLDPLISEKEFVEFLKSVFMLQERKFRSIPVVFSTLNHRMFDKVGGFSFF